MDDVLRSGWTLSQGKFRQMDVRERGDCVLERKDPLRSTPSRGGGGEGEGDFITNSRSRSFDGNASQFSGLDGVIARNGGGPVTNAIVEQSAEEALNSLVAEMKEILEAPVYSQTPLQTVSERFWSALGEVMRGHKRKEERLEQSLAKIKADFLLAREVSFHYIIVHIIVILICRILSCFEISVVDIRPFLILIP